MPAENANVPPPEPVIERFEASRVDREVAKPAKPGPSMEIVSEAAKTFQGKVNFVHVEPYKLDAEGVLAFGPGNQRQLVEAGVAWGLPTEPWVFVVDASGTVVARFEGPYTLEELGAALEGVAP